MLGTKLIGTNWERNLLKTLQVTKLICWNDCIANAWRALLWLPRKLLYLIPLLNHNQVWIPQSILLVKIHVFPFLLPISKNVAKTEPDNSKLPPSSIKAALRPKRKVVWGKVVSIEGVMNRPEKVIDLSLQKRKRTTRGSESKLCGRSSYGGHDGSMG
ncbi:unnamed protein product [Lactuca virosa]|uniref:Uncharacterized protein n=1 Tax=Lactuca virosa TaxID=75947 RepID=A0AAU9NTM3_9ASTR|nr:unnamed protein product [Lactuca virosa]